MQCSLIFKIGSSAHPVAAKQQIQLTLDVLKAHRGILIDPKDGGMLCFHANGRCITLNFGARASGWYWSRVAGLMARTSHALVAHGHVLWQYVDDLLVWLDRVSSPYWAVVLFLILGTPCHGTKRLQSKWIGWHISVATWSISVLRKSSKGTSINWTWGARAPSLQWNIFNLSLAVVLLWLTSAWHLTHRIPTTMVGMDHVTFQTFVSALSPQLTRIWPTSTNHYFNTSLVRVANSHVNTLYFFSVQRQMALARSFMLMNTLHDVNKLHSNHDGFGLEPQIHRHRIVYWILMVLWFWRSQLLVSTPFTLSMTPADYIAVTATADAMASTRAGRLLGVPPLSFQTRLQYGTNFRSRSPKPETWHVGLGLRWHAEAQSGMRTPCANHILHWISPTSLSCPNFFTFGVLRFFPTFSKRVAYPWASLCPCRLVESIQAAITCWAHCQRFLWSQLLRRL